MAHRTDRTGRRRDERQDEALARINEAQRHRDGLTARSLRAACTEDDWLALRRLTPEQRGEVIAAGLEARRAERLRGDPPEGYATWHDYYFPD